VSVLYTVNNCDIYDGTVKNNPVKNSQLLAAVVASIILYSNYTVCYCFCVRAYIAVKFKFIKFYTVADNTVFSC